MHKLNFQEQNKTKKHKIIIVHSGKSTNPHLLVASFVFCTSLQAISLYVCFQMHTEDNVSQLLRSSQFAQPELITFLFQTVLFAILTLICISCKVSVSLCTVGLFVISLSLCG